jgi:acetylornithine deacetylase/succinyl-diaminopimelate desuccinylase-like protein
MSTEPDQALAERIRTFCDERWDESIVSELTEYIRIPNKSPHFDPDWEENGHMERAVTLIAEWCRKRPIEGMTMEIHRIPGRTPVILLDCPGESDDTVLLYGHLDKQPEMTGWEEGLGPWEPVLRGERLFGRGGADDGYAAFASLTAIEALQREGVARSRCVVLIEACEESGSFDLPHHLEALREKIGQPSLVICLDSGCGNYDQMWSTTSLRGIITGTLTVETISEGVHSGDASGVVPSSFRVLRRLLDRVEDADTGEVLLSELHAEIPNQRVEQARAAASALGDEVFTKFPFHPGVEPMGSDVAELILNRTWRPTISITGARGLPALEDAGNVLRPETSIALSVRIAPTASSTAAALALKEALEADPPHGAKVRFEVGQCADGWNAPEVAPWLFAAANEASQLHFDRDSAYMGEGGSIPFMAMLGDEFPEAQFLITGVLGPKSNAHGPNEFLDIPTGKRLTACVSHVLAQHYTR